MASPRSFFAKLISENPTVPAPRFGPARWNISFAGIGTLLPVPLFIS